MKVFTNNTFIGRWGVGTAAVVVAETQAEAAGMLKAQLIQEGLGQDIDPEEMIEVSLFAPSVNILNDGNY